MYARAAAGSRIDHKSAPEASDPFMHAEQSHTVCTAGIKPDTIVVDGQDKMFNIFLERDADTAGPGMSGAVVQGFLNDAKNARLVLFWEVIVEMMVHDFNNEAGAFG